MVNPQDWLKGTRSDGMPYHVALGHPGWRVTLQQVEARSVFSLLIFVVSSCWLLLLIAGACCRNIRLPLPHKIAEVEPGACSFFFGFCLLLRLCRCVWWMPALLSGFEEDGICRGGRWLAAPPWPATARAGCLAEGEWHISLWAAKAAEVFRKHIASKGRCVATVAVSVSDRGLNDVYDIRA